MGKSNILGAWGESLAADYLQKKKYKLLASGYRCRFGEIDLIVSNKKYLVFVEVKLRKSSQFASAMEYVDYHKQNRIRTTAELYLSQNPTTLQPRFDVIEVVTNPNRPMEVVEIDHIMSAFEAGDLHGAF